MFTTGSSGLQVQTTQIDDDIAVNSNLLNQVEGQGQSRFGLTDYQVHCIISK